MEAIIDARDITKVYRMGKVEVHALRGVSINVERGEFVAIMGPSGSGKTTFMDILGCLSKPTSGEYSLEGRPVGDLNDDQLSDVRNQKIGFVFQTFNLLARATALENVEIPLLYAGVRERERRRRALEALRAVDLEHRADHYPSELSGGEQQRVAIARALVNDPAIILADEPTGNLDMRSSREVMETFLELNGRGKTIVLVTHDLEVAAYADRIVYIRDGMVEKEEVRTRSSPLQAGGVSEEHLSSGRLLASLVSGLSSGYRGLLANKMRSFLTALGIVIGVAAVIGMLGVGEGARYHVTSQIEKLGSNVLTVFYRPPRNKEQALEWRGRSEGLTYEDVLAIEEECPAVVRAAPELRTSVSVRYLDEEWDTRIIGTTPSYQDIRNHHVEEGRFFGREEMEAWAKVCVIGRTVKEELFGDEDPIGKEIKIRGKRFTVIGVMQEKGAFGWMNFDDQVLVPVITVQKRITGNENVGGILVQAKSGKLVDEAEKRVKALLLERHNQVEDFRIRSQEEFRQTVEKTASTFKLMLAGIAAISLLVGGIGIMNIMLVTVTERTREIGIRKALGAKRKDISLQFLIESSVLAAVGGFIGIILGLFLANTLGNMIVGAGTFGPRRLFEGGHSVVTPESIVLAFAFAVVVGVFFGMYPARKAAKLDPVEALRYE